MTTVTFFLYLLLTTHTLNWKPPDVDNASQNIKGVLMFRGNPTRDYFGEGALPRDSGEVGVLWRYKGIKPNGKWWGVGWTGQPLVVEWPHEVRREMRFIKEPEVEVIVAALDGRIHFLDLENGVRTRPPLKITTMPIKGTPTLDPRGIPLLYVGQGLPKLKRSDKANLCGFRIVSLLSSKVLYCLDGLRDGRWPAFDGNAVVLPERDMLLVPGENATFYRIQLNTSTTPLMVNPSIKQFKTKSGNESSPAVYGNIAYWTDNKGYLYALDIDRMELVFPPVNLRDDTDATIAIDLEDGRPFLYVGSEVDRQGKKGVLRFYKIDGLNGDILWVFESRAAAKDGDKEPVNGSRTGGILSSAAIGKGQVQHLVYFTTAYEIIGKKAIGRIIALNKKDGSIVWAGKLPESTYSSPILVLESGMVVSAGGRWIMAMDALTGEMLWRLDVGSNVESTPVLWRDRIIFGTRSGEVMAVGKKGGRAE